jgi:hypothetical protein
MGRVEGDRRTREQREYDAFYELCTVDAHLPDEGAVSACPTTGLDGQPTELVVRGAHIAVVAPYSVTQGGDLELAEVPGYGYLLPSTTRELMEHADRFQRVAVDARTGEVLAVDDAVPGPNRARHPRNPQQVAPEGGSREGEPGDDPPAGGGSRPPGPGPGSPPGPELLRDPGPVDQPDRGGGGVSSAAALLRELAARNVVWRDLSSSAYRTPSRLRRFIEHRDRTCTFPGCTVPGAYCDIDHREEWPRGGTHAGNCHVLCRRHHRAKQFYFSAVTLDPATGDTCWTTPDGATYRRPPPRY